MTSLEHGPLQAFHNGRRFEIVYAPRVGYYLYVYEGAECVRDDLQDTLDFAIEVARDDFGVPMAAWAKQGAA
jgi:hypothetical protein